MADCCNCKSTENLHLCDFCDYIYCNKCGNEDTEFSKWLCDHCQSLKKDIIQCKSCMCLFFCDEMTVCSCYLYNEQPAKVKCTNNEISSQISKCTNNEQSGKVEICTYNVDICVSCCIYCLKCHKFFYKNCPFIKSSDSSRESLINECSICKL